MKTFKDIGADVFENRLENCWKWQCSTKTTPGHDNRLQTVGQYANNPTQQNGLYKVKKTQVYVPFHKVKLPCTSFP